MLSYTFKKITNLNTQLNNAPHQSIIFVDIDHTLLIPGLEKYRDNPVLTERDLPATLKRLSNVDEIKIIGLTARAEHLCEPTKKQLKQLDLQLDEVIYAPSIKSESLPKQLQKSQKINEYLENLKQSNQVVSAVWVFDDLEDQLNDIKAQYSHSDIPLSLFHYQLQNKQTLIGSANDFPGDFADESWRSEPLGGGTNSTFLLSHPDHGEYVLKLGSHTEAAQTELMAKWLYHAMGVNVPKMAIYRSLPRRILKLIKSHNSSVSNQLGGQFVVSEYIESAKIFNKEYIKNYARQTYITHALLGNIDIKEDAFILGKDGKVYLVDAGSTFIFRSLGKPRKEDPNTPVELYSLKSYDTEGWFAGLSDKEILKQKKQFPQFLNKVQPAIWRMLETVELSVKLQHKFFNSLYQRLNWIISPKDMEVNPGHTAAGILTYTIINREVHILIGRRVRHEWWDNFGGKSNLGDGELAITAQREVFEESGKILNYDEKAIKKSPYFDLDTLNNKGELYRYRMYVMKHRYFEANNIKDKEHPENQWVPLRNILKSIEDNENIIVENKPTIQVEYAGKKMPLFPPFKQMLAQAPVITFLSQLDNNKKLPNLSLARSKLLTPWQEVSRQTQNHIEILNSIKKTYAQTPESDNDHNPGIFSQSELHLKTVLGSEFEEGKIQGNVTKFVENYHGDLGEAEKTKLIKTAIKFIQQEKKDNDQFVYFYHGCDESIAFVYEFYSELICWLEANPNHFAFRLLNSHLQKFDSMLEFIAHYSNQGANPISNNDEGYEKCAISSNPFFFGNYQSENSYTIGYWINNKTSRIVDLETLLHSVLSPVGVPEEMIQSLKKLYVDYYKTKSGGVIYQIRLSQENVAKLAYPAVSCGVINPYNDCLNLRDVLSKLKESQNKLTSYDKNYIKTLQTRLLMRPDGSFEVINQRYWLQPDNLNEFKSKLKQIIQQVFPVILINSQLAKNTMGSTKVPAFKLLQYFQSRHRIKQKDELSRPSQQLFTAIKGGNKEKIIQLLEKFPDLKEKNITQSNYDCFTVKIKKNAFISAKPIDWLLAHSNIDVDNEFLSKCYGKTWWDEIDENIVTNCESLIKILGIIPDKNRFKFAKQHQDKIEDIYDFETVLLELPEEDRLRFIEQNKDKIESSSQLARMLNYLPKKEILKCIEKNQDKIKNCDDLRMALGWLPKKELFKFAEQHQDKIENGAQLSCVLFELPEEDRLRFAKQNQNKIKNCDDLNKVLSWLPEEDRLRFDEQNQNKMENGDNFKAVV